MVSLRSEHDFLLRAQRRDGISRGGAASWKNGCHKCDCENDYTGRDENGVVLRDHFTEAGTQGQTEQVGTACTEHQTDQCQSQTLPQHELQDIGLPGPQREPDAELRHALIHVVGDNPVESHAGEDQAEYCESEEHAIDHSDIVQGLIADLGRRRRGRPKSCAHPSGK